ncbi:hypothetical protein TWF718_009876 [Orbilia javanica]|uniref:Uncharacterized protein n=1 Tax=Orbilia javanica TaxID=47235 RepID=A0AAN8RFC6_9PEZI
MWRDIINALGHMYRDVDIQLQYLKVDKDVARVIYEALRGMNGDRRPCRFVFTFNSLAGALHMDTPTAMHEFSNAWINGEFFQWMIHGLIPKSANAEFALPTCPVFDKFQSPYCGSISEPDGTIWNLNNDFPAIVLEVGWGDDWPKLQEDVHIWFKGSGGQVRVVLVMSFARSDTGLDGFLDVVFVKDGSLETQRKEIWPVPENVECDPFVTIGELYGSDVPEGYDADTRLPLRLSALRAKAAAVLSKETLSLMQ